MASFTSKLFKGIIEPTLVKTGLKEPPKPPPVPHEGTMGALLRFILVNAVSVIGAKLVAEAAEYVGDRLTQARVSRQDKREAKIPDAPTLDTRTCPKCGAFRVRGEHCACEQK